MISAPPILSDLEIAQQAKLLPIDRIAEKMGLDPDEDLEHYGKYVAKVHLDTIQRLQTRPTARYVLVTAINPTPLGEGKTTTAVGLAQALTHSGARSVVTLRQPSLGPTFGIKGGAAGGGYSQVVPMETFNLHLTGDFHAVTVAHNMIAALLDAHLFHGNRCEIDLDHITWGRVLDLNDRALRHVTIGQGGDQDGVERQTSFAITAASEIMAILALTSDLQDLRARIGRVVVGYSRDGKPVTAEDIQAAGAATVLLRDAIMPNLMQTLENSPALVHAGPFANIAHGNSSVLGDRLALKTADIVITEAGFGADIGAEKFFDIKCRAAGFAPDAAVLVVTVRALKAHTGKYKIVPGKPLPEDLTAPNVADVEAGAKNLIRHIENMRKFGVTPVVAINAFGTDSPAEHDAIKEIALASGAYGAAVTTHFADGGRGALELAQIVQGACESPSEFNYLYELEQPVKAKIEIIAKEIYRAAAVEYTADAEAQIAQLESAGFAALPVCMAKTPLSMSHDPKLGATPDDFTLPIRAVYASAGAGFIYPLCGPVNTMPGLGAAPAAHRIDIDDKGNVVGLF
jgi:formate--tetrahydrofolate ligase